MVMSVPSFCDRYTSAFVTPLSARLAAKPSVNLRATSYSAAFKMVAFSRSIRPIEPISLEMDTCTSSPSTSRAMVAARSSSSLRTVENTLDTATASTRPFTPSKNARHAASSNSARRLPSYSKPPSMMSESTHTAAISSAQSTIGGMPTVAGAPMRRMAMGARPLRSTMAFVHWVVPSMACAICARSTPPSASTASTAPMMPV